MKIVFYELSQWEGDYIKSHLTGHELIFNNFHLAPEQPVDPEADIAVLFTNSPINKTTIEKAKNLKFVATRTTGFDHINLQECAARNILVSNVPTYGENTVAEFTFALLTALSRKIYQSVKRTKETGNFNCDGLQGTDLKDKTIGIIGTGHIGAYAIKIAKGFSMNVVAYDPYPNQKLAEEYGYGYVSLEDLLKQSDVVSLHVPYMPATHHLLNSENMKLIKPGALLVNTARGGLVETQALLEALKEGRLAGAALDVLEEEGYINEEIDLLTTKHPGQEQLKTLLSDHELMSMENVLVTPHNAFNSKEALERILETTIENIQAFIAGSPKNLVVKK